MINVIVRCEKCTNHQYCPEYQKMVKTQKEEDKIAGCVGGEPQYLPKNMAEVFSYKIKKIAKDCNVDKEQYLDDIVKEIKRKWDEQGN